MPIRRSRMTVFFDFRDMMSETVGKSAQESRKNGDTRVEGRQSRQRMREKTDRTPRHPTGASTWSRMDDTRAGRQTSVQFQPSMGRMDTRVKEKKGS
jgi:hypothetical protein